LKDQDQRCFSPTPMRFALLWLILIVAGCQSINPLPNFGVRDATPEEARIRDLMKWHSGRVEVYRDFRTVFTARAVYLSDEIQKLAVDWEVRSKLMNPEERAAFEKKILGPEGPAIKILLGFYTPEEEQNDLAGDGSIWVPYLRNADGTVTKAEHLVMDEQSKRIFMRFLKWDLSWSKLYILSFPYAPESQTTEDGLLTLAISGPSGHGEIPLQFLPPDDQP